MTKSKQLLLWMLCLLSFGLAAQKTISGSVLDDRGKPISGASVRIPGTSIGAKTNSQGKFTLTIPEEKSNVKNLSISYLGYKPEEVAISDNIEVRLADDPKGLNEVIVTAQGVRRKKNTLPYAAQQVGGEEVSSTRQGNFVNSLSGKTSGIQINQANTMGGSTNVVMRGNKSLSGSNQALFVVDGIPFSNSAFNDADQRRGRGGYDYGNSAADINPDDIESITMLKGAAASALYGSLANNGVVYITTKKAKAGKKSGFNVSVQSGLTVGTIDKSTFVKYQKEYGAGYGQYYNSSNTPYMDEGDPFNTGNVSDLPPYYDDASWGEKYDPSKLVYQWNAYDPSSPNYKQKTPWVAAKNDPSTFFETSVNINNSIFVSGAKDKLS